jgi:hypothetical protein
MQVIKKVNGSFKLDILYLMFVVMAGYFWQERIINQDTAFTAFNLTALESFDIAHFRFTDVFTQIIPILMTKANLSLPTILLSYSIALSLLPYLLFRAALYSLKDKGIAWLMLLAQILLVSDYFFDAISQSKLAIALVLLFAGLIKNKLSIHNKILYYFFVLTTMLLALLCHPISLLLIIILLFWLQVNKLIRNKDLVIIGTTLAAIAIAKHFIFPSSGYENGMLSQLINPNNWAQLLQDNYVLEFIKGHFKSIYIWAVIFFLFLLFRFFRANEKKLALAYLFCNISFFALLLIVFKQGDSNMMMEKNLSTLAIVVLLPFIGTETNSYYTLKSIRVRFFLPFLCLFFLNRINKASDLFTDRQEKMESLIERAEPQGHKKYFINQEALSSTPEINLWSLPYETALLSSLNGPGSTLTIKNIKEVQYWRGLHKNKKAFIGADFFMPYNTEKFKSKLYDFGKEEYFLLEVNQ